MLARTQQPASESGMYDPNLTPAATAPYDSEPRRPPPLRLRKRRGVACPGPASVASDRDGPDTRPQAYTVTAHVTVSSFKLGHEFQGPPAPAGIGGQPQTPERQASSRLNSFVSAACSVYEPEHSDAISESESGSNLKE